MKRLLLTDYGGVLADHHQEPAESALAAKIGVTVDRCRELLNERSAQGMAVREGKLSETAFWNDVLRLAAGSACLPVDIQELTRLWAETYRLNSKVLSVFAAVRRETPIGVLTNIDAGRSAYLVAVVGITNLVDVYVPSYRCGAIKPKRELWEGAEAVIRRELGDIDITYVDDREEHTHACSLHGWEGIRFGGIDQLRRDLKQRKFLIGEESIL